MLVSALGPPSDQPAPAGSQEAAAAARGSLAVPLDMPPPPSAHAAVAAAQVSNDHVACLRS